MIGKTHSPKDMNYDFIHADVSTAVANPAGGRKISLRLSTNKDIYFASKQSVEAKPEIKLSTCSA